MAILKQYAKLEDFQDSILRANLVTIMYDTNLIQNKDGNISGAIIRFTSIEIGGSVALFHIYVEQHAAQITTQEQLTAFNQAVKERLMVLIKDIHKVTPAIILQEGGYTWQP